MPIFRVTYRAGHEPGAEDVEADAATTEDRFIVLRRSVLVVGTPREIVVRRILGAAVASVEHL